jgi:preprotein translocase subunit SecD
MGSYRALWWRVVAAAMLVLLVLVNLPLWVLGLARFSRGTELRGGYSIVFAIQSSSGQPDRMQLAADLAGQEARLEQAKTDQEKKTIQEAIGRLKEEMARPSNLDADKYLAERMIEILKERIDLQGLANLEWRPVGANRIEVRMPAPRGETRQRKEVHDRAIRDLAESNVTQAERRNYLDGTAEQRLQILARFTGPQKKALTEVGEAYDKLAEADKALKAAQAVGNEQAVTNAMGAVDNARAAVREKELAEAETTIRIPHVEGILNNFRGTWEEEGLGEKEKTVFRVQFAKDVEAFKAEHSDRVKLIDNAVDAYKAWSSVRRPLDSPEDIERLAAMGGVLEFRIVAGDLGEPLTREQRGEYIDLLKKEGPDEARRRGLPFAWFPVRSTDRKSYGGMVMGEHAGKWYMLLSNQEGSEMTRDTATGGWRLTGARRGTDQMGRPAIDFSFDEKGAKQFYALTSSNQGKCMSILLDDEVFSAPRIQSAISSNGQIAGMFTRREVDEIVRALQAGSIPVRIKPVPVSVVTFAPAETGEWIGAVIATCAVILCALLATVLAAVSAFRARLGWCAYGCAGAAALFAASWLVSPGTFAGSMKLLLLIANATLLLVILVVLAVASLLARGRNG